MMVAFPATRGLALRAVATYYAIRNRRQFAVEHADASPLVSVPAQVSDLPPPPLGSVGSVLPLRARLRASVKLWLRQTLRSGYRIMVAFPGTRWLAMRAVAAYYAIQRRRQFAAERSAAAQLASAASKQQGFVALPKTSEAAIETFHELQAARVVLNLAELLRFHRDKMGDLALEPPPLALAEECLRRAGISADRLMAELQRLLEAAPDFAEAWLELGYAHLDRGNPAAADACFDKSLTATVSIPVSPARTGSSAQAAFAKATALEAQGKLEAAAAAYAKALAIDGRAGMMHIAYGKLLRRLGRAREALAHFQAGMETDVTSITLPPLPQNFLLLAGRLAARFGEGKEVESPRSPERIVSKTGTA
jgi:Tfp pilus assembly protein PilF